MAAAPPPPMMGPVAGAGEPAMAVELRVSCSALPNEDVGSLSDPLVVVSSRLSPGAPWSEVGRTEMIKDSLNPKFVTPIRMTYRFEAMQPLKFEVFDVDDPRGSLSNADPLGHAETTLAAIVVDRGGRWTAPLVNPRRPRAKATITVVSEEVHELSDDVAFSLDAKGLDRKDFFGSSDPFVVISQIREGGVTVPVHRTEVIKNNLNPTWKPSVVPMQVLCNGDRARPLLFQVFDWNRHSAAELIGQAQTTLGQLVGEPGATTRLELVNPAKKSKKKSYTHSGILNVSRVEVRRNPSFLDYLRGGCEVGLIVAVDFTASNGDPRMATSLHYVNPMGQPNAYEQAITSVGSILAYYDRDGRFPAFGFGARMPDGTISHCFALNGNPTDPEVLGVPGILEAYRMALSKCQLYGPTIFAQVINVAAQIAAINTQQPQTQRYYVLLIITDGIINDMSQTIDQVVGAANALPLSIVICGVGNADFGAMETLDADTQALRSSSGVVASRDIVQFVPFNQYMGNPAKLAEDTLAEIPRQLVSFMKMRGILPNPAPQ